MRTSEVAIVLDNGVQLDTFDSYAINVDLLTPCAGWSVSLGSYHAWRQVCSDVEPDIGVRILLDGSQIMRGWIDKVVVKNGVSDLMVQLEGRDHLKPLVKSNIHPNTVVKDLTVKQAVAKILQQVYRGKPPIVFYDNDANRAAIIRKPAKKGTAAGMSVEKQIESLQPQPNEGAWEFLARLLRRHGLWMFGTAQGEIVVGKPSYDQDAAFTIQRLFGQATSYVKSATLTLDKTNVPSHVFVRGTGGVSGESKIVTMGSAIDPTFKLWAPIYLKHDAAKTLEQANNLALQELGRHKQNERVYEVELKGHVDQLTGAYYYIDCVATVQDEVLWVSEDLYVTSCTWCRNGSETTTRLKLVPLHSLVFEEADQ